MCEKEGPTTEHVPPLCLFPETKDLPPGINLRKNLITVPSCEEHNSKKSKDDEFLMYTLVMNLPANGTASQQFKTKIMRAMDRSPSLAKTLFKTVAPLVVEDTETGQQSHTIGYQIDEGRFRGALEKVARGIYYPHYRDRWLGRVDIHPEFLISFHQSHSLETNEGTRLIAQASDALFKEVKDQGENPEVFCYRVVLDLQRGGAIMRLSFFGGGHVTARFRK